VYVANLSTMMVENLTESPDVNEQVPRWSPDGQWISYSTDADLPAGPVTLELLNPETGARRRPPAFAGGAFVRWTPDSRAVTYARALPTYAAGDIVVQDLETGDLTVVLPPDGFEDFSPTYAPPSPAWPRR
jgi:Tol biopolymer transport system component